MNNKVLFRGLALVVVACVALVIAAYFFPLLKVATVEVRGNDHADSTQVVQASGVHSGSNMLRVDTAAAAQGVSQVAWVDKVTVSRAWPTRVVIDVTEHQAVGYVTDGSTPLAVNSHGVVFLSGLQPDGAVEFAKTKPDDAAAIAAAAKAVTSLPESIRPQLERIEAADADSVTLFFSESRQVFWGSAERAEEKAEATRIVLGREGTQWNVSNPAMPAVKDYVPPPAD